MIRKGIIGDWKTHFTAEESGEWDRWQNIDAMRGKYSWMKMQ